MPKYKHQKRYIIRKYIIADSIQSALRLEKKAPVEDLWLDNEWMMNNPDLQGRKLGF